MIIVEHPYWTNFFGMKILHNIKTHLKEKTRVKIHRLEKQRSM
ncbi:hypothetical protein MmTuc01_3451 [Methanosarcina mazei Tuc01]|uniref:Uncharacterized protein n=1 Tax=Methanosarcina mazei Tuc01 TaxID=1236903 RepID=M1Q8K3_METMZ|nr:hypothetical protein MmTuc01_3451 [Methanosarcina mazei Tuc01]